MTSTAGATRLAAYVCGLALVFGLAWAAGRFVPHVQAAAGPEPERPDPRRTTTAPPGPTGSPPPPRATGWPSPTPRSSRAPPASCGSPCSARTARPVTAFAATPRDPSPLHAVVVRRDAAGFQRLDPTMDGDGTWRIPLTLPAPGVWRAYVAMTPTAGPPLVLGADLFAPGPFTPFTFPASRTAQIGDFQLRLDGDLVPGASSQVFATISRDGGASPTSSPTSARSAASSRSARATSPTPPRCRQRRQPRTHRPRGPRDRLHGERPQRRDLPPLPAVSRSRWSCTPPSSPCRRGTHDQQIDLTIGYAKLQEEAVGPRAGTFAP